MRRRMAIFAAAIGTSTLALMALGGPMFAKR